MITLNLSGIDETPHTNHLPDTFCQYKNDILIGQLLP